MSDNLPSRTYRAVWVSDVHLGARECQAARLADFLDHTECQHLYLVGDFLDAWKLGRRIFWPASHDRVLRRITAMASSGCNVTLLPGNHDDVLRQFLGVTYGNFRIVDDCIHVGLDGRQFLVIHGDQFDEVIAKARWLAEVGERLYTMAIYFSRGLNKICSALGLPHMPLSKWLKHQAKATALQGYKEKLSQAASERGLQGVICGHTHKPEILEINGVTYMNDGDWVESCSALVEHIDGRLELLEFGTHNPLA